MKNNKPNFVLVHGAWHGGWIWKEVADLLLYQGYNVTCPTQTGLGERRHLLSPEITLDTFIDDIVNHILLEDLENVVLVGHSFAGSTISGVADKLKDRIDKGLYNIQEDNLGSKSESSIYNDLSSCLVNLGYQLKICEEVSRRVLNQNKGIRLEESIPIALKIIKTYQTKV